MEVLTKILEYGFDPAGEVQFALDEEMMVLKMPEYDRSFRLAGDDKIIPGISIANSEVGILALSIEAFYYRLVCTNGLIAKTGGDPRYKRISRKVNDEFPLVLEGVISQSRRGYDCFRISTQTPVSNPESTIETFARQFQITQEEVQIVKQAFYLEEGAGDHVPHHQRLYLGRTGQEPVGIGCLPAGASRRADPGHGPSVALLAFSRLNTFTANRKALPSGGGRAFSYNKGSTCIRSQKLTAGG